MAITRIAPGGRGVVCRVAALAIVLALAPMTPANAQEIDHGSRLTVALGASGGTAYGDPFVGGYLAARLPSESPWAFGVDAVVDIASNERYYGGFAAADRNLSDLVTTRPQLALSAGPRIGAALGVRLGR